MTYALAASSLYVVLLVVIGYATLALLLRRRDLNVFSTLGFSFVLGAFFSASIDLVLLLVGRFDLAPAATWVLAAAAVATVVLLAIRKRPLPGTSIARSDWIVLALLGLLFAAMALSAALGPLIAWDAVVIWLGKAKSFFYEAGLPNRFYADVNFGLAHLDYPVGLPLLVANAYRFAGAAVEAAATPVLGAFWYATVLLLVGTLRQFAGRPRPWLSLLLVLVVVPVGQFLEFYANGYADMPMAACVAAVVASALLAARAAGTTRAGLRGAWPYLTLALLLAIFSAVIKNEGLSFVVLATIGVAAFVLARVRPRELVALARRRLGRTALVVVDTVLAVAPLLLWIWTANRLGYPNDLAGGPPPHDSWLFYLDRLLTTARFALSSATYVVDWLWYLVPALLAFTATWWYVLRHRRALPGYWLAGSLIVAQAAAYILVYLRTPHDLTWHLGTTFDRLTLHVAPALAVAVIGYWLAIAGSQRKDGALSDPSGKAN